MPEGKSKCFSCGMRYPTSVFKIVKGKKYCPNCYTDVGKALEKEARERTLLLDYVYELQGRNKDTFGYVLKQIKNFTTDYGYTYGGIYSTLRYIYEFSDNPPEPNEDGNIGLVVSNYYKAKKFFEQLKKLKHSSDSEKLSDILSEPPEVVVLKRSDLEKKEEESRKRMENEVFLHYIDIDSIIDDDDDDEYEDLEESEDVTFES